MTSAEQYQYERGRLEEYRASLYQRMRCAPTDAARKQILDEGDALAARLDQLGDQVRGEAARNAASPSAESRYDTAICDVRCVMFPSALWSLAPPVEAEHVGELHRIEGRWRLAQSPGERAVLAGDAERLATRMAPRNAFIDVKMPGAVLDEMKTTHEIIEQLGRDIDASPVDDRFKAAWRAFRTDWENFFGQHQGWTDRFWYATYEKTVEYRTRAADWRRDFEARGGKATGPKDTPPTLPASGTSWEKVLIGAGVGVGALVGLSLLFGRR